MSYLQDLKSQVDKLQSEAIRINKYQTLFKASKMGAWVGKRSNLRVPTSRAAQL